jgi:PAS domain S-box-containing protein
LFVLAGVLSILFILGGYLYYSSEEKSIRKEKFQEIQAVTELKINQIIQWRKERLEDATIAMQAPFFNREIEQWFRIRKNLSLKKDILKQFTQFKINYDYEDIFLVSLQGEILLSFNSKEEIFSTVTSSIIREAIKRQQITFTDFYYCPTHKKIHYDIIAPVIDDKNISIAALLFRIDPDDYLYPFIQTWPTPSKTAETLLLRKDGDSILFLNELRHWKNTALKLRIPLTKKEVPAVQAALGYKGIWEGIDYRGVKVLSDVQSISGTPWFMVAKVDKSEIYSELTFRAVFISIFILVLILLSGAGLALIYSSRQRNIYRELFVKEKELREAHEEFKTILYSIGDGVITTDKNGIIKQMNTVAEQLTGWSEADAKGKLLENIFQIVSEKTGNKVENPVKRVLREGLVVGLANHTLLISRDGNEIPIADSGAPIKNERNEIVGVVLVFRDQSKERESLNALEESERLLKESQSIAHLGSYVFDLSKGFWRSSKILDDIFGIDENYIRSLEGWAALLHPDWSTIITKYVAEEVIEKRQKFDKEYKIIRKADGEERWVHGLGVLEFDKNNQPTKLIGTISDITERKHAEEIRKFAETRLNEAQKVAHIGSWELDLVNNNLIWSDEIYRIFEIDHEKFGASYDAFLDAIHPEDREAVNSAYTNSVKNKTPYSIDHRLLFPDGRIKFVYEECRTFYDTNDNPIRSVGTVQDITERKRAEEALQAASAYNRRLIEASIDPLVTIGPDGKINDVNEATEIVTGVLRKRLIGDDFANYFTEPEKATEGYLKVLTEGLVRDYPLTIRHTLGKTTDVLYNATVYKNEKGEIQGVFAAARDITERKLAEQEVRRLKDELEIKVVEKTKELRERVSELERFHDATINRELRMKELRDEIEKLKSKS